MRQKSSETLVQARTRRGLNPKFWCQRTQGVRGTGAQSNGVSVPVSGQGRECADDADERDHADAGALRLPPGARAAQA